MRLTTRITRPRLWAKTRRAQRFLIFVGRSYWHHEGAKIAAHLTFTSLFAVVPVMTVTYSILALIPELKGLGLEIQNYLFQHFVPSASRQLQQYFAGFAEQAANLTGIGLVMLFVTAVMMLRHIEKAFNRSWHVTESRKGMSGLLLYWAILSISPLLMGVAFAIPSYLASLKFLSDFTGAKTSGELLVRAVPFLLSGCAFSLAYLAIPNTRVPLHHALAGGFLAAACFEGARQLMASFVGLFPSYQLIYGAFAAVPIFLLWIYISWSILLLGAEFVQAMTNYRVSLRRSNSSLGQVIDILYELYIQQKTGVGCSETELLKRLPGLPLDDWEDYKALLHAHHLIAFTDQRDVMLSRSLQHLTLFDVFCMLYPGALQLDAPRRGAWQQTVKQRFDQGLHDVKAAWNVPMAALFESRPVTSQIAKR